MTTNYLGATFVAQANVGAASPPGRTCSLPVTGNPTRHSAPGGVRIEIRRRFGAAVRHILPAIFEHLKVPAGTELVDLAVGTIASSPAGSRTSERGGK
jgi:hypothetical protein